MIIDGTHLNYTNFAIGQPNEPMTMTACNALKVYVVDGKWQDEPCYNTYTHVVCERD